MDSDSNAKLATQSSIKAYVTNSILGMSTVSRIDDLSDVDIYTGTPTNIPAHSGKILLYSSISDSSKWRDYGGITFTATTLPLSNTVITNLTLPEVFIGSGVTGASCRFSTGGAIDCKSIIAEGTGPDDGKLFYDPTATAGVHGGHLTLYGSSANALNNPPLLQFKNAQNNKTSSIGFSGSTTINPYMLPEDTPELGQVLSIGSTSDDRFYLSWTTPSGGDVALTNNNLISSDAGSFSNSDATYNVALGFEAGHSNTTGDKNVFIGYYAGYAHTTNHYNVFIGYAAHSTGTADALVCIGKDAGKNLGDYGTAIGYQAGGSASTGSKVTLVGANAGNNCSGASNTFMGYNAGVGNKVHYTGAYNTAVGVTALARVIDSTNYNVAFGYNAGYYVRGGSSNICLGAQTGPSSNSTDSYRLYIDPSDSFGTDMPNRYKGESSFIYGDKSGTPHLYLNADVTIGDTSKDSSLDGQNAANGDLIVYGEVSATKITSNITGSADNIHVTSSDSNWALPVCFVNSGETTKDATTAGGGTDMLIDSGIGSLMYNPSYKQLYVDNLHTKLVSSSHYVATSTNSIAYLNVMLSAQEFTGSNTSSFMYISSSSHPLQYQPSTGNLTATKFTGDGSGLYNLPSGGGITIENNINNRVLTSNGTNAYGEGNLTFDGNILSASNLKIPVKASDTYIPDDNTYEFPGATMAVIDNATGQIMNWGGGNSNNAAAAAIANRVITFNSSGKGFNSLTYANVCFLPGTKITLSNKIQINIEKLKKGDILLSYKFDDMEPYNKSVDVLSWFSEDDTGEFTESEVTNIWSDKSPGYIILNDNLHVTHEHLIFTKVDDEYTWLSAKNIRKGDIVFTHKGEYEEITKIEKIQEEVEVYNLRVTSSAMNYFADSYLVHNASLCDECAAKNNKL